MKNTTIFLLLLILFSCNSTKTDLQKQIDLFENHIGLENAKVLTGLVNEFEEWLIDSYPRNNIDSSYTDFLRKMHKDGFSATGLTRKMLNEYKTDLEKTSFQNEIACFADSVGFYDNQVFCYFPCKSSDYNDTIETSIILTQSISQDSIQELMDWQLNNYEFNVYGKYFTGLDLIKSTDDFLISYLDFKKTAGFTSYYLLANSFLYEPMDFSNYFYKRILLIELMY